MGQGTVLTRAFVTMNRFTKALHYVFVALSRYRCYRVALRRASQGSIIICDRYPLAPIHRIMRDSVRPPMDGPKIACMYRETEMKGLTAAFSKIEQNLYQHIRPADHLLLLHVSPDVSRKRKPELSREEVEAKIQAVQSMDRGDLHVTDIDADQPFDQALLQVKSAVWNIL